MGGEGASKSSDSTALGMSSSGSSSDLDALYSERTGLRRHAEKPIGKNSDGTDRWAELPAIPEGDESGGSVQSLSPAGKEQLC